MTLDNDIDTVADPSGGGEGGRRPLFSGSSICKGNQVAAVADGGQNCQRSSS